MQRNIEQNGGRSKLEVVVPCHVRNLQMQKTTEGGLISRQMATLAVLHQKTTTVQ